MLFFAKSRGRICRDPYHVGRRYPGGSTASAAPFVTNPNAVSRSHSHSGTSGGRRSSVFNSEPRPYALIHCGGREIGRSAMFCSLRVFRRAFFPNLNTTYGYHTHIQSIGVRRWSVSRPNPRPEPNFMVAHFKVRPRAGIQPSGYFAVPSPTPKLLPWPYSFHRSAAFGLPPLETSSRCPISSPGT